MLRAVFLFLAFALSFSSANLHCLGNPPSQYTTIEFGGRCYQIIIGNQKTWQAARAECQKYGGDLATVETNYVNNFLEVQLDVAYQGVANTADSGVWIGGEDFTASVLAGQWKWVIQHGTQTTDFTWSNWDTSAAQPGGGLLWLAENCVAMRKDRSWQWHDYVCDDLGLLNIFIGGKPVEFDYVCEWEQNETLSLAKTAALGNICKGTTATASCEYDHAGPFKLYTYALIKFDINGQNAMTVYNNTNNQITVGNSWTNRVSGSISGPSGTRYTATFQISSLVESDAGKYGCQIQYVEFDNPFEGGASLIQASAGAAQSLSIMIAPDTQFAFTICRRAEQPQCQSTGTTQNFRKISFRAFPITSTSDQFNAICTLPTNPGTPAGSLRLEVNGKQLEPNAQFPNYLYAQQTVQQLLDANTAANTNNLYLSCSLVTEATTCLANQGDATKTIQIGEGPRVQIDLFLLVFSCLTIIYYTRCYS